MRNVVNHSSRCEHSIDEHRDAYVHVQPNHLSEKLTNLFQSQAAETHFLQTQRNPSLHGLLQSLGYFKGTVNGAGYLCGTDFCTINTCSLGQNKGHS